MNENESAPDASDMQLPDPGSEQPRPDAEQPLEDDNAANTADSSGEARTSEHEDEVLAVTETDISTPIAEEIVVEPRDNLTETENEHKASAAGAEFSPPKGEQEETGPIKDTSATSAHSSHSTSPHRAPAKPSSMVYETEGEARAQVVEGRSNAEPTTRPTSRPSPAPAKSTRLSTKAKKQALKATKGKSPPGEQKNAEASEHSLYDLEWQSEVGTSPSQKDKTVQKSSGVSSQGAANVSVDMGPMFAKRGGKDLRQVDQSVNLMEFNDDSDSLDGSPTTSQVSASSRISRGRRNLNAPHRPSKFTQRPSHVNVHRQEIDSSLLGVVEGGKGFRSARDKKYNGRPAVSDVEVDEQGGNNRGTKDVLVFLVKLSVIAGFVGFGIFIFFAYSEGSSALALSESSSASELLKERGGEVQPSSQQTRRDTDDEVSEHSWEVHLSAHLSQHQGESVHDESNPVNLLESIILEYEVSLPENLEYANYPPSPQVKALMWLAHSDAYKVAEMNRDVSLVKLIQRYALGVLYYSVGGHHQQLGSTGAPLSDRDVHVLDSVGEKGDLEYQGWKCSSNWMTDTSVCLWHGVTCTEDKLVESLNLTDNGLRGMLPMLELFQAFGDTLKCFDVSRNMIRGSLALPGLPSLSNNTDVKQWTQLEHFYVNDNEITGSAPFDWFGMSSQSLLGINMARNRLSKLQDSGITNLGALEELYLSYNVLVGSLPRMSNLTNLQILHLNDNLFRGSIPAEIFHLTSLVDFHAGGNNLTGTISIDLSLLNKLEVLSMEHNRLTGHIPDHFHLMPVLKTIDLSANELRGTVPLTLANVTAIERISLEGNHLSGTPVPTIFTALTKLQSLLLHHNDLYGSVPATFCKLHAGYFHLHKLNDLEMDCLYEIVCDCCDECY